MERIKFQNKVSGVARVEHVKVLDKTNSNWENYKIVLLTLFSGHALKKDKKVFLRSSYVFNEQKPYIPNELDVVSFEGTLFTKKDNLTGKYEMYLDIITIYQIGTDEPVGEKSFPFADEGNRMEDPKPEVNYNKKVSLDDLDQAIADATKE